MAGAFLFGRFTVQILRIATILVGSVLTFTAHAAHPLGWDEVDEALNQSWVTANYNTNVAVESGECILADAADLVLSEIDRLREGSRFNQSQVEYLDSLRKDWERRLRMHERRC